ncbi:hypothetical protein KXD40_003864 [Peronospora effusa]|uniref:Cwf19-like C-terminal domain-containing protein n=1 Tax=Peronospora effusa TaxID=542832 RepID=A0A3M6VCW0_9STRA|nr:hypothetical protein DD238_007799 [Peronospora effusa]RQM13424.1 hypothetical protein DD237_007878 [Peronospora effusa]UIZ23152.1 hypothetical protein KXD40_003864 [Peronospora effusa]CAI5703173.1 unnamed protein product [Peronospora effusa]
MSSLLQGLKFVRRSEGDDRKHKRKEKKKKEKKHKKEYKNICKDKISSEKDEETKEDDERIEEKKTILPRDESYLKAEADPIATIKTAEELNNEAKQMKIQEEIDAGMREPVTGMVYGLYDPKNPDAAPTISSKIVRGEVKDIEMKGEEEGMPLFGDGGASWRAKMLKRAHDRARSSGVALEKVVNERFRSVSALKEEAKGSARENAHLQYKRHQIDDEDEVRMTRKRQTLEIGRDAKDKALLSNYSTRVQRSVAHNVEGDSKREESRRQTDRSSDREEDGPIDYDRLPDFENRGTGANASRLVCPRSRTRDYDKKAIRKREFRHQNRGRSRSRSRGRSDGAKRPRSEKRSGSRSRHRSCSPFNHDLDLSDKSGCDGQNQNNSSKFETRVTLTSAAITEHKKTAHSRAEDEGNAEKVEMEKRSAFLYGNKKTDASTIAEASNASPSLLPEQTSFENETARVPGSPRRTTVSASFANDSANEEDEKAVLNKLAAKALRAQMMGKPALFRKLTEQLNELEAKLEREKTAAAIPHFKAVIGALPPLEKEDMRFGSRKGKKKLADPMTGTDVAASLEELVREQRLSSAHVGYENMDAVHARNIVRLGSRYKGTAMNAQNFSSGFDEEDQVDMKMLQQPGSNLTRRAQVQREHAIAVKETKWWDERTQKCQLCMKSPAFKKHLTLSLGEFTYLAVPNRPRLHPRHCLIVPIDHTCSAVQADEQVREEITCFQGALASMCEKNYGASMVFIEQTSAPHRKRHTMIECIPVDSELALDMPLYFKQELMQATGEWDMHQPIIDTSKGGITSQVPQTFSYFHIEWRTREGRGGYAHVIEDENTFPRDFGVNVVAGMLDVTLPKYGRRDGGNRRSLDDDKHDVLAFLKDWEPFDWTRDLDGGDFKSQARDK